jgi:hypothetical protein
MLRGIGDPVSLLIRQRRRMAELDDYVAQHFAQRNIIGEPVTLPNKTLFSTGEAHRRALALLEEHLNEEQQEEFKRTNCFFVTGQKTGTLYFFSGDDGYVYRDIKSEKGTWYRSIMCINPDREFQPLPIWDALLAKKLLIEVDEEQFLAVANTSRKTSNTFLPHASIPIERMVIHYEIDATGLYAPLQVPEE